MRKQVELLKNHARFQPYAPDIPPGAAHAQTIDDEIALGDGLEDVDAPQ